MSIKKARGVVSTILILSGAVSFFTGAVLYFLKVGMWLCFTRKFLTDAHELSALIMGIAIVVHLVLNRKIYKMEMQALCRPGEDENAPDGFEE